MWRRTYFFLVLVRLYFALCTSYLHPDEHFQGPEVIAGEFLYTAAKRMSISCSPHYRTHLFVSRPSNMGIYVRQARAERISPLASLRSPYAHPTLALGRVRPWLREASSSFLDATDIDVRLEFRA